MGQEIYSVPCNIAYLVDLAAEEDLMQVYMYPLFYFILVTVYMNCKCMGFVSPVHWDMTPAGLFLFGSVNASKIFSANCSCYFKEGLAASC